MSNVIERNAIEHMSRMRASDSIWKVESHAARLHHSGPERERETQYLTMYKRKRCKVAI